MKQQTSPEKIDLFKNSFGKGEKCRKSPKKFGTLW